MHSRALASLVLIVAASLVATPVASQPTPGNLVLSASHAALTEGGSTIAYTVSLSNPAPVAVTVAITFPTADLTATPASLTFAAGTTGPFGVTLAAADDAIVEGTESLTVLHTASSADPTYSGKTATLAVTLTDNDLGVALLHTGAGTTVSEAGTTDTFTVALGAAPASAVTVRLTPDPQLSVSSLTMTFSAANWKTPRTVTVAAANDQVAQGSRVRAITAAATSADPAYSGQAASLPATIEDNDVAGYRFSTASQTTLGVNVLPTLATSEGGSTSYKVRLNSQPTANVVLGLSSTTGLSATPSSLTFTPANWATNQSVGLTQAQDVIDQGSTYASLLQQAATSSDANYASAPAPITVTITDDDSAAILLTATGGSTVIKENGTTDTVGVRLATQPRQPVTLSLTLPAGATVTPSSLTFTAANWNVAQTVTLTAVDDQTAELPQSVALTAVGASADSLYQGRTKSLAVTLADDDGVLVVEQTGGSTATAEAAADTFTVRLIGNPAQPVTVHLAASSSEFTVNGGATATLTFTSAGAGGVPSRCPADPTKVCQWDQPQTVTIAGTVDNRVDGVKTGKVTLRATSADSTYNEQVSRPVSVTVTDVDVAGFRLDGAAVGVLPALSLTEGGSDTYTVALSSIPSGDVTLALAGTTGAVPTPATLVFGPGNWSTPRTVTVSVARDQVDQGASYSAGVVATASSSDPLYTTGHATLAVTVADPDDIAGYFFAAEGQAGLERNALPATLSVAEGNSVAYSVRLASKPTADVVLSFTPTGPATATPTLTFTPGNYDTAQEVTLTATQDDVDRGATYALAVNQAAASSDPMYAAIPGPVTATATDNDVAGLVWTATGGSTQVQEGGLADVLRLKLATEPTGPVTVALTTSPQASLSAASLSFTPANWATEQDVTVTAADDADPEVAATIQVTATAASADALYQGKGANAAVLVLDNDGVVLITQSGGSTSVAEGVASGDSYTVALVANPTSEVQVTVSSPTGQLRFNGGASATLTFLPAGQLPVSPCPGAPNSNCRWDNPQTVTVTALDDAAVEGPMVVIANHAVASTDARYNNVPSPPVAVRVLDNDRGVLLVESGLGTAVAEGGASDTYTAVLSVEPTFSVALALQLPDRLSAEPAVVLFDAESWMDPQTITISTMQDAIDQPASETLDIRHELTSADPAYNQVAVSNIQVAIADDDTVGVTILPTGADTTVAEGGTNDAYTLALVTQPTADVTVAMTASVGLATTPTSVTFTPEDWNAPRTVTVRAPNDNVAYGSRTGSLAHAVTSADAAYNGLAVPSLPVAVVDNDAAGITVGEDDGNTLVTEAGAGDSYSIKLTSQPTSPVTITIVQVGSQLTRTPAALTFDASNWNKAQWVTVFAVNDAVVEGAHTGALVHDIASSDQAYDALADRNLAVQIVDND